MISTQVQTIPELPARDAEAGFGALKTERGNLPLTSLDVQLASSGLSCRTELVQGFTNPYEEVLEATYIFPLPDRAAVTSLRLEAADRVVEGVLRERGRAREEYDEALARGQRAAIAEEERPGVFTMRVGNILPGEEVRVRLTLVSRLPFEDGVATMRFPLVVAPRYIPGVPLAGANVGSGVQSDTDDVQDASRITPPVLLPGFTNPVRLSIMAEIDPAGLPVSHVASSLHPVSVEPLEGDRLRVRVDPGQHADRDFILRMRLGADDAITQSLVVVPDDANAQHAGDDGDAAIDAGALGEIGTGTFALTILPPRASTLTHPRDVVLVLDRSGSMSGWKMVAARRAAARIVDTLSAKDRFAVLAFDDVVETPPELPATLAEASDRHRFRAIEFLAALDARRGTEILEPLERAARIVSEPALRNDAKHDDTERERVIVLVTDGQVGNEDQVLRRLRAKLQGVRIHAVGIDTAVNAGFLQRLVGSTGGRCELVESEDALDRAMDAIHHRIGTPLVTDLRIDAEGLALVPDTLTPSPLPALYSGAPVVITGRYRGEAAGGLAVRGKAGDSKKWGVRAGANVAAHAHLGAVWARSRVRDLEDAYGSASGQLERNLADLEKKIVATSLRFGVLSRFTAFTAIDTRVVNEGGRVRHVTQPIELPMGWTRDAIGAQVFASARQAMLSMVRESAPTYPVIAEFAPNAFLDADDGAEGPFMAELPVEARAPYYEERDEPVGPPLFEEARARIADALVALRHGVDAALDQLMALYAWLEHVTTHSPDAFSAAELDSLRELMASLAPMLSDLRRLAHTRDSVIALLDHFPWTAATRPGPRGKFWLRNV